MSQIQACLQYKSQSTYQYVCMHSKSHALPLGWFFIQSIMKYEYSSYEEPTQWRSMKYAMQGESYTMKLCFRVQYNNSPGPGLDSTSPAIISKVSFTRADHSLSV